MHACVCAHACMCMHLRGEVACMHMDIHASVLNMCASVSECVWWVRVGLHACEWVGWGLVQRVCVYVHIVCVCKQCRRIIDLFVTPWCKHCIERTAFVFQSASDPPPNYEIVLSPASLFEVDAFGFIHLNQEPLDYETRNTYVYDVRILFHFPFVFFLF